MYFAANGKFVKSVYALCGIKISALRKNLKIYAAGIEYKLAV